MQKIHKQKTIAVLVAGAAWIAGSALSTTAMALTFDAGDWQLDLDTSLTGAAQWRTESRDKKLSTDPDNLNYNDGNNNFDDGSMTSAKGSFILEFAGKRENLSFFVRTDGLYDYVYEDKRSDLSEENYLTYNGAIPNFGTVKRGDFPDDTLDEHGKRLRLLEAFVNYDIDLESQAGSVRLGRQVIAWGEALLYQGVNALQNPLDAGVALSPGVEAKEIFLPTGAFDVKWNFTDNISSEAYYKLEWEKSTLPGVGSFLSPADTGPGAERVILTDGVTAPVISEDKPGYEDQWGLLLRYVTDYGTTFSVSRSRSNANTPGIELFLNAGDITNYVLTGDGNLKNSYSREIYLDSIDVWQFGVNTTWGEASVYADLVYVDNGPFVDRSEYVDAEGNRIRASTVRGEYQQLILGMLDVYTALPWLAERFTLTAEAIYQTNNLGKSEREDAPYGITEDAWGYRLNASLSYYSVLPGMDLEIPLSWRQDVDGYGASVLQNSLIEGQKWASVGAKALYLDNWEFEAKYSFYFGNDDPGEPILADRDNVTLSAKYKF